MLYTRLRMDFVEFPVLEDELNGFQCKKFKKWKKLTRVRMEDFFLTVTDPNRIVLLTLSSSEVGQSRGKERFLTQSVIS